MRTPPIEKIFFGTSQNEEKTCKQGLNSDLTTNHVTTSEKISTLKTSKEGPYSGLTNYLIPYAIKGILEKCLASNVRISYRAKFDRPVGYKKIFTKSCFIKNYVN